MSSAEGTLAWKLLADHLDLVAPPVAAAAATAPEAKVAEIDPHLADTAAFCQTYDVDPAASANCVIVTGKRGDQITTAAVLVLATDRADINRTVRKHLDARKVTFADQSDTEAATGMTSGGITPLGLPPTWRLLIDDRVAATEAVVIGGGLRGSKILLAGSALAQLPGAEVLTLRLVEA